MGTKKKTPCALVLIAALSCAPALAQSATTAPASGASSGTGQEGVKVHGDWTLTVRNPDGTVAARHEFKNALAAHLGGDRLLAQLLGGAAVAGIWTVGFNVTAGGCNAGTNCTITESASTGGATSRDLTKSVPVSGPDAGKFVLRGSVRILNAATIDMVQTALTSCAPSVSPASCIGSSANEAGVTQKWLSQGVTVAQDQLVEVKVVISFS
jgi:hypothetical protein